jgi:RimJ/RimL family protein N-acetyltransferase
MSNMESAEIPEAQLLASRQGSISGDASAGTPQPPARRWIPIRSLGEQHRPRILSHLSALPVNDRYLRFGYTTTDAQIERYADSIDFTHDEVFGVFNRRLDLIALAHLASLPDASEAEFGVSVLPHVRGRGYGGRLFERAVLHARNRGVDTLLIHALAENMAMLRIARRAGAIVHREGPDTTARLRLPPDDLRSHLDVFFEISAAEVDYGFKAQSKAMNAVLDAIADTRQHVAPGKAHKRSQ